MKLYEISEQFQTVLMMSELNDGELDSETLKDTLEAIEGEFDDKVDSYGKVIRNFEANIEARKAEIERLKELNDNDQKQIENMKNQVGMYMDACGKKKAGIIFKFSRGQSAPKIRFLAGKTEEDAPADFWKVTEVRKFSKVDFNKAVKANPEKYSGIAEIYRDDSLRMK